MARLRPGGDPCSGLILAATGQAAGRPSRSAGHGGSTEDWSPSASLVLTAGYRVVVRGQRLVDHHDPRHARGHPDLCGAAAASGVRLVAPIAAVVLFVTLAWVFVPDTLAAGIPTPGSVTALADLVRDAREVIVEEQAPVAAARGIVLLLAAAFGALVVVADAFLELRRAAAWVGLLLLGVFAVPAMVSGRTPGFWLFVVAAVPWLVLLRSGRHRRPCGIARQPRAQVPAIVLAVAALGYALVLPTVAPDIRAAAAAWGKPPPSVFGRGINPMLELGQNLRRNSTTVALTYTTTSDDPLYLKVATLRDFTGKTWRPGPRSRATGSKGTSAWTTASRRRSTPRASRSKGSRARCCRCRTSPRTPAGLEGAWRYERMGMTVRSDSNDTRGQTYSVTSLTITPTAEQMRQMSTVIGPSLSPFVTLPADVPQSIVDTARDVTASAQTDYDRALALQDFLRNGDFRYSETAPVADDYDGNGLSVVAEFLERKAGYCVHFASAMAVMARTIDIPSRIAVGYAPGRITGVEDGETVYANTSDDLHAWTELFFEGAGWVRFDPTTTHRFGDPFRGAGRVHDSRRRRLRGPPGDEPARPERGRRRRWGRERLDRHGAAHLRRDRRGRPADPRRSGVLRELRRRRRLGSGSPVSLWRELEDVALDLGLDVPDTDTPRGFAARLAGRPGVDADALDRLLHRVELARFARPSASGPTPRASQRRRGPDRCAPGRPSGSGSVAGTVAASLARATSGRVTPVGPRGARSRLSDEIRRNPAAPREIGLESLQPLLSHLSHLPRGLHALDPRTSRIASPQRSCSPVWRPLPLLPRVAVRLADGADPDDRDVHERLADVETGGQGRAVPTPDQHELLDVERDVPASTDTAETVTGLQPGRGYYIKVRVITAAGDNRSAYSEAVRAWTSFSVPSGLKATKRDATSATLDWSDVAGAPRYRVLVADNPAMTNETAIRFPESEGTVTGLAAGKTYYAKVRVISDDGVNLQQLLTGRDGQSVR